MATKWYPAKGRPSIQILLINITLTMEIFSRHVSQLKLPCVRIVLMCQVFGSQRSQPTCLRSWLVKTRMTKSDTHFSCWIHSVSFVCCTARIIWQGYFNNGFSMNIVYRIAPEFVWNLSLILNNYIHLATLIMCPHCEHSM